jgi:rare lipoprotein A (peptidoglycan hydrolase)
LVLIVGTIVCIAVRSESAYASQELVGKTLLVRASYYGGNDGFNGQTTANCTVFRDTAKTAAHKTLPLGTKVILTNHETECSEVVTITDRGPFKKGRDIDVAKYGVGKPLSVGENTELEMHIVYVPEEPIMGKACK